MQRSYKCKNLQKRKLNLSLPMNMCLENSSQTICCPLTGITRQVGKIPSLSLMVPLSYLLQPLLCIMVSLLTRAYLSVKTNKMERCRDSDLLNIYNLCSTLVNILIYLYLTRKSCLNALRNLFRLIRTGYRKILKYPCKSIPGSTTYQQMRC
jgi:hypothetical protein